MGILNAPFCAVINIGLCGFPVIFSVWNCFFFFLARDLSVRTFVRNMLVSKIGHETDCGFTWLSLVPPDKCRDNRLYLIFRSPATFSYILLRHILTLRLPNWIPYVIRVTLVAGEVLTNNCTTGKLSALIQRCNIVQKIERDSCQRF
jgi:hypothetical protein